MDKNLLYKYIAGDATAEEKERVTQWIDAEPKNMQEYLSIRKLYTITIWQEDADLSLSDNGFLSRFFFKRSVLREIVKIAAVFILAFPVAYACLKAFGCANKKAGMQTIYVPAGQRAEIILSDSSKVWLNAKTKLTFPSNFEADNRTVSLDGEGYFCVSHNKKRPFIVKTRQYDIKVLGTEFNVQAYKDNPVFETALLKGSVQIDSKISRERILLEPDKKMDAVNGEISVTPITQYNYFRWKEGLLCFDNNTIDEMFKKLQLCFDVRIIVKNNQILNNRYTGKFRIDDGVEQVLKTLQLSTKFDYEKSDDKENLIIIK